MKQKLKNKNLALMITFIFSFFICIFIGYKLFLIQVDSTITLTHSPSVRNIEAPRGNILSEDGRILSVTMPVYDIRLDLHIIDDNLFNEEIFNLSKGLNEIIASSLFLNSGENVFFMISKPSLV